VAREALRKPLSSAVGHWTPPDRAKEFLPNIKEAENRHGLTVQ
jgi:hypothetical protein